MVDSTVEVSKLSHPAMCSRRSGQRDGPRTDSGLWNVDWTDKAVRTTCNTRQLGTRTRAKRGLVSLCGVGHCALSTPTFPHPQHCPLLYHSLLAFACAFQLCSSALHLPRHSLDTSLNRAPRIVHPPLLWFSLSLLHSSPCRTGSAVTRPSPNPLAHAFTSPPTTRATGPTPSSPSAAPCHPAT